MLKAIVARAEEVVVLVSLWMETEPDGKDSVLATEQVDTNDWLSREASWSENDLSKSVVSYES